jgi:hypothetical protein
MLLSYQEFYYFGSQTARNAVAICSAVCPVTQFKSLQPFVLIGP